MENLKILSTLTITFSLILMSFVSTAPALQRFEIVTTKELELMLAQRAAGKLDFVLVNSLDALIFENHFIPGSINIPWHKVVEKADRLGIDKNRLIITYCMGYR